LAREREYPAPILVADIGALPVQRRGVVVLEEDVQQRVERHDLRVELDEHRFGVAGRVAADGFVRRVVRDAARVPDRRRDDARNMAEGVLDAPKAARGECGQRVSLLRSKGRSTADVTRVGTDGFSDQRLWNTAGRGAAMGFIARNGRGRAGTSNEGERE